MEMFFCVCCCKVLFLLFILIIRMKFIELVFGEVLEIDGELVVKGFDKDGLVIMFRKIWK